MPEGLLQPVSIHPILTHSGRIVVGALVRRIGE
jgi:hypothetical protein